MIQVKRGDTLSFIIKRKDEMGEPETGVANNMFSQVRNKAEELIGTFTIVETAEEGSYLFLIPSTETQLWSPGTYFFDIEYRDGDFVSSSQTEMIQVLADITRHD